jgi:membrane protein implicated in regulation of membrane protease activity
MWPIAGILLGLVVVASVLGFHAGPHMHLTAGFLGLLAAVWLVAIALTGQSWPGLWVLFSADVVISASVGVLAWKGLTDRRPGVPAHHAHSLDGAHGVAVTDLTPAGIIRVHGEEWSAVAANRSAPAGTLVQVLGIQGVRLDVWAEETSSVHTAITPPEGELGKGHPS